MIPFMDEEIEAQGNEVAGNNGNPGLLLSNLTNLNTKAI